MSRSTRSQNAEAGPSQSQRRRNGVSDTQYSTQDDESLRKPDLSDDEDGDEREKWTIDTFENQPVSKDKYDHLLRSLDNQIDDLIQNVDIAVAEAKDTAVAIEDICPDDAMIDEIQAGLIRNLTTMDKLQLKKEAIASVLQRVNREEDGCTADVVREQLEAEYARLVREYDARSEWSRFKTNERFIDFRTGVWEVNHEDAGCPPMSTWLAKGPDDDEDEIEVGGVTQTFRCPITGAIFKDACKSTQCGHYYEYEAIIQSITLASRRGGNAKCPQFGCAQVLTKTNIQKDPAMQRRANQFQAREEQRREEEEDLGDQSFMEL